MPRDARQAWPDKAGLRGMAREEPMGFYSASLAIVGVYAGLNILINLFL